jgi:uncharacterized membrane protein
MFMALSKFYGVVASVFFTLAFVLVVSGMTILGSTFLLVSLVFLVIFLLVRTYEEVAESQRKKMMTWEQAQKLFEKWSKENGSNQKDNQKDKQKRR